MVAETAVSALEGLLVSDPELALTIASQLLQGVPPPGEWTSKIRNDDSWTGAGQDIVVLEIIRNSDGAKGYAALSGVTPGDRAQTEFVEQFQDVILENSNGYAWPECPGHPHPMNPFVVGGRVEWRCPGDAGEE